MIGCNKKIFDEIIWKINMKMIDVDFRIREVAVKFVAIIFNQGNKFYMNLYLACYQNDMQHNKTND